MFFNKNHKEILLCKIGLIFSLFFAITTTVEAGHLTPGVITECGELSAPSEYILGANLGTSTETCLIVTSPSVTITGSSTYEIRGNIVGNRGNYTINNATTTGDLSIFYYNNDTGDNDWSNLDNWWLDSNYTETANYSGISLPADEDSVVIDGKVDKSTSGTPTAHSARFINDAEFSPATLPLDIAPDAAAAYSLRNLSSDYDGPVVRVRRSSDNAEADFTAEEIENDTLLDWVVPTTTQALYNNAMYFDGVDDYVDSGISFGVTSSSSSVEVGATFSFNGSGRSILVGDFKGSTVNTINLEITTEGFIRFYLSDSLNRLKDYRTTSSFNDGLVYSVVAKWDGNELIIEVDGIVQSVTKSYDQAYSGNFGNENRTFLIGTDGRTSPFRHVGMISNAYVKKNDTYIFNYLGDGNTNQNWIDQSGANNGVVFGSPALFTGQGFDGYVRTWYDQGGNDNHAVQSTSNNQPLLISNGNIVTKNDVSTLEFNGTTTYLDASSLAPMFSGINVVLSAFITSMTRSAATLQGVLNGGNSSSTVSVQNPFFYRATGSNYLLQRRSDNGSISNIAAGIYPINTLEIISSIMAEDFSGYLYTNGGNTASGILPQIQTTIDRVSIGGGATGVLPTIILNGNISEIIIYPSDKSSLRSQIESSINSYYNIYSDPLYDPSLNLILNAEGGVTFEDNSNFGTGKISTSGDGAVDYINFDGNSYAEEVDLYTDELNFDTQSSTTGTYNVMSGNTDITINELTATSSTLNLTGNNPNLTLNNSSAIQSLTADDIDLTLNGSSYINNYTLNGDDTNITFNTTYYHGTSTPDNGILEINNKTITGTIAQYSSNNFNFYDSNNDEITQVRFSGTSTNELENLPIYSTFYDTSINSNNIRANAVFRHSSINESNIYGNVTVHSPVTKPLGGTVFGNITYVGYEGKYFNNAQSDDSFTNDSNWWTNDDFDVQSTAPIAADDIYVYGDLSSPSTQVHEVQSANFYSGTNDLTIKTTQGANFYGSSINNGVISGTTTFYGNLSENTGYVTNDDLEIMHFDGLDDVVRFSNPLKRDLTGVEFGFEFDIKASSAKRTRPITFGKSALNTGYPGISFWAIDPGTNDRMMLRVNNGSAAVTYIINKKIIDLEWHNVKVYQPEVGDSEIYVDGVYYPPVYSAGGNAGMDFSAISDVLRIGADYDFSEGEYLNGVIKDFKVTVDGVDIFYVHNTGPTSADWLDQIGSNHGTVYGSPTSTTTPYYNQNNGTLIRRYESDVKVGTRDFTLNNGIWQIEAAGADVDISSATYSTSTNIFRAINGGTFIENESIGGGEHVVPKINITYPTNGTNTALWNPQIDWDDADTCEYKYGANGTYQTVDCNLEGTDIPKPTALQEQTIYLKGSYSNGSYSEQLQTFIYDNVSPIDIDCSLPLDEATREYYYLESNITADCYITASSTIRGNDYTITGNIIANASSTNDGNNLALENITITGTTTANGTNGGNGGNITITDATTGAIQSNGGNNTGDGGNGGTIIITNSLANPLSSTISVIGGSSLSCGNGGDSGSVTLINSSYGTVINTPGNAENSGCPSQNKQGGQRQVVTTTGEHSSQVTPSSNNNSSSGVNQQIREEQQIYRQLQQLAPFIDPTNFRPNQIGQTRLPQIFDEDFQSPGQLQLTTLPTRFVPNLQRFVLTPVTDRFSDLVPQTTQLLSSVNITKEQDIARISRYPELIENPEQHGLFKVYSGELETPTYLTYEVSQETFAQLIKIGGGQLVNFGIKLSEIDTPTLEFQGKTYNLTPTYDGFYATSIETPNTAGRYILRSNTTDILVYIDVQQTEEEQKNPWGIFNWLWRLVN